MADAQTTRWNLTTADFQSTQVDLDAINDAGLRVRDQASAPPRLIGWENLLALDRTLEISPPAGKFILNLVTGDQIRGEPVKIEGESLNWNAAALGEMSVPLQQIATIARPSQSAARRERQTEDVVTLANGDTVRGIISALADKQLTVQVGGAATAVPLDSIAAIHFATTASSPAAQTGRAVRVRLADDSLITAKSVKTQDQNLVLTFAGSARTIPLTSLAALEQINGPVSWLSSRIASENTHTPLLQTSRPARMDKTVTGKAIRFGDRTYARGIGVAPHSRITFPLDPREGYQTFRTRYAIDGHAPYADVTVRILLDGKPVYESKSFTAGRLSPVILVPLGNARSLTLEVEFGGNYNVQDRLNWIESRPGQSRPDVPRDTSVTVRSAHKKRPVLAVEKNAPVTHRRPLSALRNPPNTNLNDPLGFSYIHVSNERKPMRRGRPAKHYTTSSGEVIVGLYHRGDGRWVVKATGETFSQSDERLAVQKYRRIMERQSAVKLPGKPALTNAWSAIGRAFAVMGSSFHRESSRRDFAQFHNSVCRMAGSLNGAWNIILRST